MLLSLPGVTLWVTSEPWLTEHTGTEFRWPRVITGVCVMLGGRSGEVSQAQSRGPLSSHSPCPRVLANLISPNSLISKLFFVYCCAVLSHSAYFLLSCRVMGVDIIFIFPHILMEETKNLLKNSITCSKN